MIPDIILWIQQEGDKFLSVFRVCVLRGKDYRIAHTEDERSSLTLVLT